MKRTRKWVISFILLSFLTAGCYGSFSAFSRLKSWNQRASNEPWANEVIFLILNVVPVYGVTLLADAILFNSLAFWTGDNPMDHVRFTKDGNRKAIQEFSDDEKGKNMKLMFYDNGFLQQTLTLHQDSGSSIYTGTIVGTKETRTDFLVEVKARGIHIVSSDGSGKLTSRFYPPDALDKVGAKVSRLYGSMRLSDKTL
jgi:hypothetical protein